MALRVQCGRVMKIHLAMLSTVFAAACSAGAPTQSSSERLEGADAGGHYTFVQLGPGGTYGVAMNNAQGVVGGYYVQESDFVGNRHRAFFWSPATGMVDLSNGGSTAAYGVNDLGAAVVSVYDYENQAGPDPFEWANVHPLGGRVGLGDLGQSGGEADSINNDGVVVGGALAPVSGGYSTIPIVYGWPLGTSTMTALDLPPACVTALPQGIAWTGEAYGLNEANLVVGACWEGETGGNHVLRWDLNKGVVEDFGPGLARRINASNLAVGAIDSGAAYWDAAGEAFNLGALPGDIESVAFGVNDAGDIVGLSASAAGERAFLSCHGDRKALIDLSGVVVGLTVREALAIDASGDILASAQNDDGMWIAVLLQPVAPGGLCGS
jgi:uncharacterized membrane protein